MMSKKLISIIVPVLNEEDAIPFFHKAVRDSLHFDNYDVEILFVNDGSSDKTQLILESISQSDPFVSYISFSRNFGKEAALFAGLEHVSGDAVIPVDVDLQEPIHVIYEMVAEWEKGADIVLAKRRTRSVDSFLKRKTAELFYKIHKKIAETPIDEDVGDFRLLTRKAVEAVKRMPERKLFMKGIFSWVGFKSVIVYYDRDARIAGNSKFNVWRLWNFALEGITSFSTWPLRVWTYIGTFVAFISFLFSVVIIIQKICSGNDVAGYPSLITSILFFGGVQLMCLGILGEYIGRIYMEVKQRPRYIIDSKKKCSFHDVSQDQSDE